MGYLPVEAVVTGVLKTASNEMSHNQTSQYDVVRYLCFLQPADDQEGNTQNGPGEHRRSLSISMIGFLCAGHY
jgi:hypothetical protein